MIPFIMTEWIVSVFNFFCELFFIEFELRKKRAKIQIAII